MVPAVRAQADVGMGRPPGGQLRDQNVVYGMRVREIAFDPSRLAEMSAIASGEENQALHDHIIDAVEALPSPMRDVVECVVWGRMSMIETATILNLHRSYVCRLWEKAQATLAETI